ncbi:MAG: LemA family protein [Candidatus Limnocylindrales bacterium]
MPDQAAHAEQTTTAVRSLFAVVEQYPALASLQNVLDLQDEIERLESMIADRRELYNDQVYRYNTRIATIPTLILAGFFGWAARPFFTADPGDGARPSTDL